MDAFPHLRQSQDSHRPHHRTSAHDETCIARLSASTSAMNTPLKQTKLELALSAAATPSAWPLLSWYDRHARELPWRVPPAARRAGTRPNPYRVWLSEIMLQQTTVSAVKPYFAAFVKRWPTVNALAEAGADDVMKAWAGLGYYARARNLKACAETIALQHGGQFPDNLDALRALPGIGPYTAAAIAAIAFDHRHAAIDGNVERVVSRLFAIETPLPASKREIRHHAEALVPSRRAGDFAQALMDLGATICTPRRPACALCPWRDACAGCRQGLSDSLPRKAPKAQKETRRGASFVAVRSDGAVLLRRRPARGLLGGMSETPSSAFCADFNLDQPDSAPLPLQWERVPGLVAHTFTHFHLRLSVWRAEAPPSTEAPLGHWWSLPHALAGEALPSVMRKVLAAAMDK